MPISRMHCILAVWGEEYTHIFLKYSLPSQLAEGNLPVLRGYPDVRYRLFTTEQDMAAMRRETVFRHLESLVHVEFMPITVNPGNKLSLLAECHNSAIRSADQAEASLIFLSPDFIFARGSLAYGLRQWASGSNVVYTLTPRLARTPVLEELDALRGEHRINLDADDLGDMALRHLHPIERGYFYAKSLVSFPVHIYWQVGREGFVAHCAYLHPLFIAPLKRGDRPAITIDADYVDRCCPDQSRIHVVDDSSKMLCVELSSELLPDINSAERGSGFPATPKRFARWAVINANPASGSVQHHWLLQHAIRVHGRRVTEASWSGTERAARRFIRTVRLYTALGRHGFRRFWRIPSFWYNTRTPYTPVHALLRTEHALEAYCRDLMFRVLGRLGYTRRRHKKVKRCLWFSWRTIVRILRNYDTFEMIDMVKEKFILRMDASAYRSELMFLHAQSLFSRKRYAKALEWHARALPGIRTLKYKRIVTTIITELDGLPSEIRKTAGGDYWKAVHHKAPHALGPCILLARELLREGRHDEARTVWEAGLNAEGPDRRAQWAAAHKAYLETSA